MNISFLSSDSNDATARAIWQNTTVDMVVVRCNDSLYLVFDRVFAGTRAVAGGDLRITAMPGPEGWAVFPEGSQAPVNAPSWGEALEHLLYR